MSPGINGHTCIADGTALRRCGACAVENHDSVRRTSEVGGISAVYAEVWAERARQDRLWGRAHDDSHTPNEWIAYITRYSGEAAYSFIWRTPGVFERQAFRAAMVKIAALAIAAIEWIDRK